MTSLIIAMALAGLALIIYINVVAWKTPPRTPEEEEEDRRDMQVW
jgi:hypothetical protein